MTMFKLETGMIRLDDTESIILHKTSTVVLKMGVIV